MPVITRIVAGKKNPSRANVYLDGKFAFALSIDEVVKQHLRPTKELSDNKVQELINTDNTAKVYGKILNFISFRPRTIKEVKDRLYQYDVKELEAQNSLIDRLSRNGYLDDLAFAKWFIESRNTHKLRSPRMIRQELSVKGISREIQDQVVGEIEDESKTIARLLTKKLGEPHPLTSLERQKIGLSLTRQGFAWDKIKEVVKTWESE